MKRLLLAVLTSFVLPAAVAHAHSSAAKPEHKITFESARLIAQAKVPKGMLTSHGLLHEHGHLLYSFWFVEAGKSGGKVVDVDAATGRVVKVKHESIESARKEKAKEEKQQFRP